MISLVLRSARVPKIQIQGQRTGYQSQIEVNYVVEDDVTPELNNLQEFMEQQEHQGLPEIREAGRPHDGSSFCSGNNPNHHFDDSDLNHEEISTIDNDSDVNEQPGLEYRLPSSGSPSSIGQSTPDPLIDYSRYDNEQRLAGQFSEDEISCGPQGDNDQEIRGDLVNDAVNEDYFDDDMEEPVWSIHHNFEDEAPFHDYNWQQSATGIHVYGEDIDLGHGHQVHLDVEADSEPGLPSQSRFLESDEAEGARDEHSDRSYWAEQNLTMESDALLLPRETIHSQLGFVDHLMENPYDIDGLDCAMDEPIGELGGRLYYADAFMHLTEVFTDEDADLMPIEQEGLDEGQSVDGEFYGNSVNDDVAKGKGAFVLCGEDASRPITRASHHNHLSENVFDDSYIQGDERSLRPRWTASNYCTGSTSAYA